MPIKDFVAAVSVGISGGAPVLDLNYREDAAADVDMNVVMTGRGGFVELQGTAERRPFAATDLSRMLILAARGIREVLALQRRALGVTSLRNLHH
jgi:ribonuclease PH